MTTRRRRKALVVASDEDEDYDPHTNGGESTKKKRAKMDESQSQSANDTDATAAEPAGAASNDAPDWFQKELERLRVAAEADFVQRADVVDATLMEMTDEEFQKLADESARVERHEQALKIKKDGIFAEFDRMVKKAMDDCHLSNMDEDDDEVDEGSSKKSSAVIDDDNIDAEEACIDIGSSNGANLRIKFQGTYMELAKTKDEYREFAEAFYQRINSYAEDPDRIMFIEKFNESTIYRGIGALHKWLVFCAVNGNDPDQVSPEVLMAFRTWILGLKTNVKRLFVEQGRFNKSMQHTTISSIMVRIFMMVKIMGIVPITIRLGKYLGGRDQAVIFRCWMDRQPGIKNPFARLPILPSNIDYFIEQLHLNSDKEFEAILYMLTLLNAGSRSASLLHVNSSCHRGLLGGDLTFILLPNRRVSFKIVLRHEKQSKAVNVGREIVVEDRFGGVSTSMLMFVQFVRLDFFIHPPNDILDPAKFCGIGEDRFELRSGAEKEPVFRRWFSRGSETAKFRTDQYMADSLTVDTQLFEIYSEVLRLPKRGFSSRSVRQGLAICIILDDIRQRGYFDKQAALNRLTSTYIWDTGVAMRYVEDYIRNSYHPTAQIYGSSSDGRIAQIAREYVSPSHYRLTAEEYVKDTDPNIVKLAENIPEVVDRKRVIAEMESQLQKMIEPAELALPPSLIFRARMKSALNEAKIETGERSPLMKLKNSISLHRQRLRNLIRDRCAQYADDINYRRFMQRKDVAACKQDMKVVGITYDFEKMAVAVHEYNSRQALWAFSPFSKPNLVQPGEVICLHRDCDYRPRSSIEFLMHLSHQHQINVGGRAKKTNIVERFASRGKPTNDEASSASNVNEDDGSGDEDEDETKEPEDVENDGEPCVSSKKVSGEKFLMCKAPACGKTYIKMSHLSSHFKNDHWLVVECKTCKKSYTAKFKPKEHEGHKCVYLNNSFKYGEYLEQRCPRCEPYTVEVAKNRCQCVVRLEKVQSALKPEFVDELYEATRAISPVDEELEEAGVLERKRKILYHILTMRLYGRVENVKLPTCVVHEIQRRYWDPNDPNHATQSQEV